jgi:hypothetical protein
VVFEDLLVLQKSEWCYFTCLCKLKDYIYVSILRIATEIRHFVARMQLA